MDQGKNFIRTKNQAGERSATDPRERLKTADKPSRPGQGQRQNRKRHARVMHGENSDMPGPHGRENCRQVSDKRHTTYQGYPSEGEGENQGSSTPSQKLCGAYAPVAFALALQFKVPYRGLEALSGAVSRPAGSPQRHGPAIYPPGPVARPWTPWRASRAARGAPVPRAGHRSDRYQSIHRQRIDNTNLLQM